MKFNGKEIDPAQLYTQQEVLDILEEGGGTDRALVEIRDNYEGKFGDDLVWRYPIMVGFALGAVLIQVREGILSIAYDAMDPEEYELYDLKNQLLLSADDLKTMKSEWDSYAKGLSSALKNMWGNQYLQEHPNQTTA